MLNDVLAGLAKAAADRRAIIAAALTALTALGFGLALDRNPLLDSPMRLLVVALGWAALVWIGDALLRRLRGAR